MKADIPNDCMPMLLLKIREENLNMMKSGWKQVGWLILLWSSGVISLTILASIIRLFMTMAGLKS